MLQAAGQRDRLSGLRRHVERVEQSGAKRWPALAFGVPELDACLPRCGLQLGALHEVSEAGCAPEFAALSALFTASIAGRLTGEVVWCLARMDLFMPGLAAVGLAHHRVLFVETWHARDVLPAMEEALAHRGLAAVVGEVARLSLTASRRLQLAAERTGAMALAIRRCRSGQDRAADGEPTAAVTRWQVSPHPGTGPPSLGLPRAHWRLDLLRARGASAPHSFLVDAPDAAGRLRLSSDLGHRSREAPLLQRARVG